VSEFEFGVSPQMFNIHKQLLSPKLVYRVYLLNPALEFHDFESILALNQAFYHANLLLANESFGVRPDITYLMDKITKSNDGMNEIGRLYYI
jgi:hypothetical protein